MLGAINLRKLLTSLIPPAATGFFGWLFTRNSMDVYGTLEVPPLSPPGAVFPIVWSILFFLMGISFYLVRTTGGKADTKKSGYLAFAVQLIFNFLWTIAFFRLGWYGFAAVWLAVLIVLIVFNIIYFAQVSKTAGWLLVPYLVWCVFALYLNIGIWALN